MVVSMVMREAVAVERRRRRVSTSMMADPCCLGVPYILVNRCEWEGGVLHQHV